MRKDEAEQIQEDRAQDHVDSIKDTIQGLLESNEPSFNEWILLITEVEDTSPDEIQKICLVYDSFLSEFPLCYGYWIRYAEHNARLCTLNEVEIIYERAVKAASHSIHLWVSYCNFGVLSFEDPADVRRLFERGLSYVDKDYFCYLLWDKYIEFEYSQKQWSRLAHIYINTLCFPSRRLLNYYESFKKLVALLEEHMELKNPMSAVLEAVPDYDMTYMKVCGYTEISNIVDLLSQSFADPEVLKKFIFIGELLYQRSCHLDKSITCFEAHIKRHHFHMMPLDEFELENWHNYLTFIEGQGNFEWTVKLYERCLIPCANYSEFWIRYVDFVDVKGGREIANDALDRALNIFLKRIPSFRRYYSIFKEKNGDPITASFPFLQSVEVCAADVVENVSRSANMEKRMGNIEAAQEIFDKAIRMAHEKKNLKILSLLYVSLARFTFVVTRSVDVTKEVFIKGIHQNPSKSIIEGFLDFMTMHGGTNHVDFVECKMASLLSPESVISQALSSHDREEVSQLYLKFVDLYGTIHDIRKAWERHMKLFPHIMRPSTLSNNSSNQFRVQSKKIEGPKGAPSSSPNHSGENHLKTYLAKSPAEIPALMNKPITLPEEVLKFEQKPYGKAENVKERQEMEAAEANSIQKQFVPERSEISIVNKFSNEPNDSQIPDASLEYHETEVPSLGCEKEESYGNTEPPANNNLSIANTFTSLDNSISQDVTSKKDGNKAEDGSEMLLMHSSPNNNLNCESNSQVEHLEESSLSLPASHAASTVIRTVLQSKFQETLNINHAFSVNAEHSQNSGGGQCAQVYHGIQSIADPNSMLHGYIQTSWPQQWQANVHMQNQSGGTNLPRSLAQSYVSETPLLNSQVQQANHTQAQYQLASSQAYDNQSLAFHGQQMQQPSIVYSQDQQLQQASSQTQIQAYQSESLCDGQYGYYQNVQGYPPHIWQYYQNLYYLQQQEMQQRQHEQQVNFKFHKQQLTDPSQSISSQQEVLDNKEESSKLQIQPDIQQFNNIDKKGNATKQQQNQQEKLEELIQPNQHSMHVMNHEQSQLFYFQQQQQFYFQQQQQYQMYMQQQHLLQQQQHQQQLHQQQHQQLLVYQQQLQFQHQQQMPIPTAQQEQLPCTQPQKLPLQHHNNELQQQNNALEMKAVESDAYCQDKGDAEQTSGKLGSSCST